MFQVKSSWKRLSEASLSFSRGSATPLNTETVIRIGRNGSELFKSVLHSVEEWSAGRDLQQWELELHAGISTGLAFRRLFQYSGGEDGLNIPRSLNRSLELYKVGHRPKFLLRAELTEKETFTGGQYIVTLSSSARTIVLSTHSDSNDGVLRHGSEFRWRPEETARIAYEIEVENRTTSALADYVMTGTLITPVRSMALTATSRKSRKNLRSLTEFVWDLERKESAVKITFRWDNITKTPDILSDRIRISFSQGTPPLLFC